MAFSESLTTQWVFLVLLTFQDLSLGGGGDDTGGEVLAWETRWPEFRSPAPPSKVRCVFIIPDEEMETGESPGFSPASLVSSRLCERSCLKKKKGGVIEDA